MDQSRPSRSSAQVGSGGVLLGLAKLVFILAAYITSMVLTRLVDPSTFGSYGVLARIVAIPNMVIVQTMLFAVSRPLAGQFAEGMPSYYPLRRRGLLIAITLGGVTTLVFACFASAIADFLQDPALTLPLRVLAPISLVYAVYAVNVGTLNATRKFKAQAALDMFMAVAKASLTILAALLYGGLAAIVGGFTTASIAALSLSAVLVMVWRPKNLVRGGTPPKLAGLVGVLVAFSGLTNMLLSADVLILKRFATDPELAQYVGYYASAQLVAMVPYSLLNAVNLLMFPLIATLDAQGDKVRIRQYVGNTWQACIFLLVCMAAVAHAAAHDIQALLFPTDYGTASADVRLLVWGYSGYSLVITTAWIFTSSQRSRIALFLVGLCLLLVVVGAWWQIPLFGHRGAGQAVAIAGALGAVVATSLLVRYFRFALSWSFIAKVTLAVVLTLFAGEWIVVHGKLLILVKLVLLTVLFVSTILLSRAITKKQLQELRSRG